MQRCKIHSTKPTSQKNGDIATPEKPPSWAAGMDAYKIFLIRKILWWGRRSLDQEGRGVRKLL